MGLATNFIHASAVVLEPASSNGLNRLPCTVVDAAFMGDHIGYVLNGQSGLILKARSPIGALVFARGANVVARLPAHKLIVIPRT
jgi:hypothetical protein